MTSEKKPPAPRKRAKPAPPPPAPKKRIRKPKPKAPRKDRRGTPAGLATAAGPHGGAIGNPPFVPTKEQRRLVETHAAVGTQHELIAELMDISGDTLVKYFAKELRLGRAKINARIGASVAKKALEGSAKHEFFWLKTRGGYSSKQELEHSGPGGKPLEIIVKPKYDMSRLSLAEARTMLKLGKKAAVPHGT